MILRHVTGIVRRKFLDGSIRRFTVISALAFWLGGFTFYGAVVIPAGVKVLHGHLRQGFITQEVTGWLNISAAVALMILLFNLFAGWSSQWQWARWTLAATWALMAVAQVVLFLLHPSLDHLLDAKAFEILDYDRFEYLHRIYLVSASVQWAAGVLHLWCVASTRG